ncbi:MAG TPA: hypothetical protein VM618_13540, partial [Acidimicrobiia bacterium]|nr:hypothetical protein [Acidimicrobiia bacterium]
NYSVYAVGSTCGDDSCTVLWRSSDGGRSWTRLKADGLRAHTILVPANSDGRKLFAVGATGVQVSDDGGKHFHQALAASYDGPAAVSPAYNQTPTKHLYLGAAPNWTFDAATEVAAPLAMGLPGNLAYFAFDPQFATNERMYAGTTGLSDDTPTVFVCDDGWCAADDAVALPELDGTPRVAVPKSDASLVFAWYGERMYRSPDAGVTFAPVTLPLDGRVTGLSDNGAGTIFASVAGASDGGGVVRSHDGGVTWTVVGSGTSLVDGADAVVATADRVYAAPRGGGIMCSRNDGITWSDRC